MNPLAIGNSEARARRMRAMIQRLDVDMLELAYADLGSVYTEAARRCLHCETTAECLRWLETAECAERPAFCPNLELFERFGAQ